MNVCSREQLDSSLGNAASRPYNMYTQRLSVPYSKGADVSKLATRESNVHSHLETDARDLHELTRYEHYSHDIAERPRESITGY